MDTQEKIEQIKTALAAVDNAIAQTQSALQSPSTSADDVRALRATLIDLQTQRSQLSTELINLEAAQSVVPANTAVATDAKTTRPRKMRPERAKELQSIQRRLDESIIDRSAIRATLAHATKVHVTVKQLQKLL